MKTNILAQEGYGVIEYPSTLKMKVDSVIKTFEAFCKQKSSEKIPFTFNSTGGYEYKDENMRDFKENFHVSLNYKPQKRNLTIVDRLFLKAAEEVIDEVAPLVSMIAQLMTIETGYDFVRLLSDKKLWSLRFLHYMPSRRKVIADPHADKGTLTLHLRESSGGLEYFWKERWQPLDFSEGETGYLPGLLGQYHSKCKIKALSHRVVSTVESRTKGRFSIVLFVDTADKIKYNKDKFGSSHDCFPPGSNYDMIYENFFRYFTETENAEAHL